MEQDKNPWDEDYVAPQAQPSQGSDLDPWDEGYSAEVPQSTLGGGGVSNGPLDNPLAQYGRKVDADAEAAAASAEASQQGALRSQSEIYDPVDQQDKYAPLRDYEDDFLYQNGINFRMEDAITGKKKTFSVLKGLTGQGFTMPPELEALREQRDQERQAAYNKVGQADTMFPQVGGIPVRTQEKRENNPAFDPSMPEGPENPAMISTRYLVDPPELTAIQRMGYQVLQNIGGGVGDFLTEGKLTGEGAVGRSMPETVPNQMGEKFVTDMTTFIVGPMAVGKVAGAAIGATGGMVAKAAQTLSPEATQAIKAAYDSTIKATGSAVKAKAAANAVTRNMLVGLSLGIRGAGMATAEGIVAPNDSQGLVPADWLAKNFNMTRERADDLSMMLDSPIIGGTLSTFGKMYNVVRDKVFDPTIGSLRNVNVLGAKVGKAIPMTERQAGLKLLTRIDPNLTHLAPEDAAFKIKALGDAVQRNGTKNLQLASAGKQIKLDTPAAFQEVAEDYYRVAYADRKEVMGEKEFNDWVSEQAHTSSRTLFEIRTAISSNDPNAIASTHIMDLLGEGSNSVAGGNLLEAQGKLGQMAEQVQTDRTIGADMMVDNARKDLDEANFNADNALTNDPEFKQFLEDSKAELGSKDEVYDLVNGPLNRKTYEALKTLKKNSDASYKKIADSGADVDPSTFMEVVKKYSDVTPADKVKIDPEELRMREKLGLPVEEALDDVKITDPDAKRWVESLNKDPSFDNAYNKVRNEIKKKISTEEAKGPGANSGKLDMYRELRDNIEQTQMDFLHGSDNSDVVDMVNEARGNYKKLHDAFKSSDYMKPLYQKGNVRIRGEGKETATGIPVGKTDWDKTFGNQLEQIDGVNGKAFREALKKGVEVGGQDISGDLAHLYATKVITNLSNALSAGGKQSVSTLRSSVHNIVEGLKDTNPAMAERLRRFEQNIQTLENTAVDKAKAFESIKQQAAELQQEASRSVLSRFIYSDGKALEPSEVGSQLKKIFRNGESVSTLKRIMKEADAAGQGDTVREALQGSYLDYFRDRVGSKSNLGIGTPGPNGEVRSGFRISETQAEKIFDEGGNDLANMREIFSNKPEIIDSLNEIRDVYTNISKKTPKADGDVLGPIDRSEDPEQGLQTLVTLVFGPLNRTGSKVRRLTTPIGVESLAQVKETRSKLLFAMMEDPDKFAKVSNEIKKGILSDDSRRWLANRFGRGFARANSNFLQTGGDARKTPALRQEMMDMK